MNAVAGAYCLGARALFNGHTGISLASFRILHRLLEAILTSSFDARLGACRRGDQLSPFFNTTSLPACEWSCPKCSSDARLGGGAN